MTAAAPTSRRLTLPAAFDAPALESLLDGLRDARGSALTLEAHEVRRLGGQGAQLLLAAARSWRADGARLALADPSPDFLEALRLLGLAPDALTSGDAP